MKIFYTKTAKRFMATVIGFFLLVIVLINAAGYFLNLRYLSVFAAAAEIDKFEVRSRLLQEAMGDVGVCDPDKAVQVWASGLGRRSAALQYAVMTAALKEEYARQLETTFPNWVTGLSSPYVTGYQIISREKVNDHQYTYCLRFSTATSTGPAGDYNATLTISKEGDFWRISHIETDEGLYPYTGFRPQ